MRGSCQRPEHPPMCGASRTVDTYRKRVYEKTGIHKVRQLQLCVALMRTEQQESETQKE